MARKQTDSRLIEAAAHLFHQKGYAATGNAEILAAAGAGAGSLYHHFRDKEDLLVAVLEHYHERFEAEIAAPTRARTNDPIGRVFGVLDFYRDFLVATECRLGCPIGNLAGEVADTHPLVRAAIEALFQRWRGFIEECFRRAQSRLPSHADPADLAVFFLAVMEGAVMQARVAKSLEPFETSVRLLREFIQRLITQGDPS